MRTLLIGGIFLIFIVIQLLRGGGGRTIVDGDGSGYYAYLTTVFVHGTTDFTKVYEFEKSHRGLDYLAHYFHSYNGVLINKYFLGTALLILPFYLLAWLYSLITGMPPDGYNFLFQYAVALAAAFYCSVGLLFINRTLRSFGISKWLSLLSMITILAGTNLFYYTFMHPSHSHVYSFAAVSVFVYYARSFFIKPERKQLFLTALSFGLVVLIRPTNAMVLMGIPFIAGSRDYFMQGVNFLKSNRTMLLVAVLLSVLVIAFQLVFNLIQTGQLLIWSYQHEGFYFLHPSLFSFLFSYRKGFFVYTPMFLLIVPSLIFLFRNNRFQFWSFSLFMLLLFYILSSWWNWFFGDSFGMRALIDYFPLLMIPVVLMVKRIRLNGIALKGMLVFIVLAITLNLIQTYQYQRHIIHPDSMTKEKYWYVFLKTAKVYEDVFGGFIEPVYQHPVPSDNLVFNNDFEANYAHWSTDGRSEIADAWSGKSIARMGNGTIYSPTLILDNAALSLANEALYVTASVMYREKSPNAVSDALLVYAVTNRQNNLVFYKTFKIKQMPDNEVDVWRKADFGFKVPAWDDQVQQVKIYVWQQKEDVFELDDFNIKCFLLNSIESQ